MILNNIADSLQNGFKDNETVKSFFGPLIGRMEISDQTVASMLHIFNNLPPDHPDNGALTSGQVKNQPKLPREAIQLFLDEMGGFIHGFMQLLNTGEFNSNVIEGWYIDQKAGEYNPMHSHRGTAELSCVGYLIIPEDLKKLWAEDPSTNDGAIQFLYGNIDSQSRSTQWFRPKVGEFYIFPSCLLHCVYPFKGEGSRLSFSMNIEKLPKFTLTAGLAK
jgi:hypothetical protein